MAWLGSVRAVFEIYYLLLASLFYCCFNTINRKMIIYMCVCVYTHILSIQIAYLRSSNKYPLSVPLRHVDYFDLKAIKIQWAQEKLLPLL